MAPPKFLPHNYSWDNYTCNATYDGMCGLALQILVLACTVNCRSVEKLRTLHIAWLHRKVMVEDNTHFSTDLQLTVYSASEGTSVARTTQ